MRHSSSEYLGLKAGDAFIVSIYLLGMFILAFFGGLLLSEHLVLGTVMLTFGVAWSGACLFVVDLLVRDGAFNRGTGR